MSSEDVILIGAGRHPYTKQVREQAYMKAGGHIRRTFWIGPLHVRSGMRFPVGLDFVRQHIDQLIEAIRHGTLLVEYKFDKYVDPEELRVLAFGSEEERAGYESKQQEDLDQESARLAEASERRRLHELEARRGSVLSRSPAAQAGRDEIPVGEDPDETLDDSAVEDAGDTELNQVEVERANGPLDNIEGSHEEAIAATAPDVDESLATPERTAELEAQASAEPETELQVDDGASPLESDTDPARLQRATKAELLQMCAERGIDTSDMPSNKILRQRLEGKG